MHFLKGEGMYKKTRIRVSTLRSGRKIYTPEIRNSWFSSIFSLLLEGSVWEELGETFILNGDGGLDFKQLKKGSKERAEEIIMEYRRRVDKEFQSDPIRHEFYKYPDE